MSVILGIGAPVRVSPTRLWGRRALSAFKSYCNESAGIVEQNARSTNLSEDLAMVAARYRSPLIVIFCYEPMVVFVGSPLGRTAHAMARETGG